MICKITAAYHSYMHIFLNFILLKICLYNVKRGADLLPLSLTNQVLTISLTNQMRTPVFAVFCFHVVILQLPYPKFRVLVLHCPSTFSS